MKDKLRELLVGKEFYINDYNEELNSILKKIDLEVNTSDFDFDRIYTLGYNEIDDWSDAYIGSLDIMFDLKDEEEVVKIVDVF